MIQVQLQNTLILHTHYKRVCLHNYYSQNLFPIYME